MPVRVRALAVALLLADAVPTVVGAQSVLQRTPNLSGGWPASTGTVYFNFLHRFSVGDAPARKVVNVPTFLLGTGLPGGILIAANYSTNSNLVQSYPNEWEFLARAVPLQEFTGFPVDVSVQAGYNNAAESWDGEVELARQLGRLRLLAVARGFSKAYGVDEKRFAFGGGGLLQLTRSIAVGGDYVKLTKQQDTEDAAWSAALQIGIPSTPHTLSLQVANTWTATMEGSSRGSSDRRYGFEFTVPITLARYFGKRTASAPAAPTVKADGASGHAVNARMRNLKFEPAVVRIAAGESVVWRNEDQVVHTVKAQDGSWESPQIEARATYTHTFTQAGRYEITCGPHPFMKQTIEVR